MGLYRDGKMDLHLVFIDLEKAYDRVLRDLVWSCLEQKGVLPAYILVIKDMYDEGRTRVRTPGGPTDNFTLVWACIKDPL